MLLKVDTRGKKGSLYQCDRCKVKGKRETIRGIYRANDRNVPVKVYDLCDKCWQAFKRGIEKYG